jgi:hypothetical protein
MGAIRLLEHSQTQKMMGRQRLAGFEQRTERFAGYGVSSKTAPWSNRPPLVMVP